MRLTLKGRLQSRSSPYPFRSLEKAGVVKLDRGPKRPSSARRHLRHCPAVCSAGQWLAWI